jgi:regulator of protease activity HflC (stomatin/prohibitin superfamily)
MSPEILFAGAGITAGVVLLMLAAALTVIIIWKGFNIVKQAEVIIVERLGKYHKTLTSGVNIIIPLVDKVRQIYWRAEGYGPGGIKLAFNKTFDRIDLRETVFDFPRQNVITRDNVTIEINALLYFQVTDPVRAVYEVQNLPDAIEKLTQTTLRNVIGELDLDQTLSSRDTINMKLRTILDEATDKWGVKVNRVELQDINPPEAIRESMEKQMRAERERRAQVLAAEGSKAALVLNAEGDREAAIASAEGAKRARVLHAEGEAESRLRIAEGEAQAVKIILDAVGQRGDPVQYMVAMKYIDALKEMAASPQKTVFLPYEASGVMGALGGLKKMFDADKNVAPAAPKPPVMPR